MTRRCSPTCKPRDPAGGRGRAFRTRPVHGVGLSRLADRGADKAGWRMRRWPTGCGSTGRRAMARRWPRGGTRSSHLAQDAGFHTAAVMPQITLDWPESLVMGFDTVLAAADLGYAGLNFNWVTMPDQFTYAAMDRLFAGRPPRRCPPVSSRSRRARPTRPGCRCPSWWSGTRSAMAGSSTRWRRRAIRPTWSGATATGCGRNTGWPSITRCRPCCPMPARHAAEPPLMIVLGDHQAAGFVRAGRPARCPDPHDRPGASGRADGRLGGLAPGLIPPPDAPVAAMDRMRDRILQAFTTDAPQGGES